MPTFPYWGQIWLPLQTCRFLLLHHLPETDENHAHGDIKFVHHYFRDLGILVSLVYLLERERKTQMAPILKSLECELNQILRYDALVRGPGDISNASERENKLNQS